MLSKKARNFYISCVCLSGLYIFSYFGWKIWPLELISHFLMAGVIYVYIRLLTVSHRTLESTVMKIATSLIVYGFFNYFIYSPLGVESHIESPIQIVSHNVLSSNTNYKEASHFLESKVSKDSIIFLMEINEKWKEELASLSQKMPNNLIVPREDNFGLGVWTNIENAKIESKVISNGQYSVDYAEVIFTRGKKTVSAFLVHTLPPINSSYLLFRNKMLEEIAIESEKRGGPVIVAGDFNTTPWSGVYRKYFSNFSRFKDGIFASNTWVPFGNRLLGLPIDHVIHTDHFLTLSETSVHDPMGSDHKALVVNLDLKFE